AFLSRTVDGVLTRGSRRALARKFWTPQGAQALGLTTLGTVTFASDVAADGRNVWVTGFLPGVVQRVRAGDGRLLETWTGAAGVTGLVAVPAGVFATSGTGPGRLYRIDPSQPAGAVTTV